MSEYTPGPWGWMDMGGIKLVGQHGHRPIVMDFVREGMQGATLRLRKDGIMREFDANHPDARLIAAAPELFKALVLMIEVNTAPMNTYDEDDFASVLKEARDTVAKAAGRGRT